MVRNQAYTICCATLQCTALTRLAEPTPIIEPDTTWVVLTGKCKKVAEKITKDEFRSAAKPLIGSILKILVPIVFMIFQPPAAVPSAIAVAQTSLTQVGTSNVGIWPALKSANVIMPMAFCASLEPWEKAIKLADRSCIRLKPEFNAIGANRPKTHNRMIIIT